MTTPAVAPLPAGSGPRPRRGHWRRARAWAFSPAPAATRSAEGARTLVRIGLIMVEEYFRTHITIRASALTFAIILSIVPLLALSTSILKGLGNEAHLRQAADRFIEQLAPSAAVNAPPGGAPAGVPAEGSFTAHLHQTGSPATDAFRICECQIVDGP